MHQQTRHHGYSTSYISFRRCISICLELLLCVCFCRVLRSIPIILRLPSNHPFRLINMGHAPSSPCLSCAVECSNAFEHRLVSGPPSFHSKTADGSGNDIHASSSQNDLAASRRQSIGPPPYTGSFILPPNSPPIYDVMLTTEPLEHPHSSPSINFSAAEKSMVLRDPHLNHNPTRLLSLINCIVENLPKLYVRIRGVSLEGFHRRTDFDVKIDLTKLYTSRGSSSRMGEVRTIGSGVLGYRGRAKKSVLPEITDLDGLEKWVKMYCEDSSRSKRCVLLL